MSYMILIISRSTFVKSCDNTVIKTPDNIRHVLMAQQQCAEQRANFLAQSMQCQKYWRLHASAF